MLDKACYWGQGWRAVAHPLLYVCKDVWSASCSGCLQPCSPPVQSLSGTQSPNKVPLLCALAPGILSRHQKVTNTALYHDNEKVAETM